MSLPIFITNRYITSKGKTKFISLISLISILGISLGVAVLIIALTILNGFEEAVSDKIIKFNSHLKVTSFGNRNLPGSEYIMEGIRENISPYCVSISPFVSKLGIIKSKKLAEGITLTGIDPMNDNSEINKFIIEGEYNIDSVNGLPVLIMGKKLADKLFVNVNDKVTIFSLRKDEIPSFYNPPAIQQFTVSGIYESGMADYDDINAFISIKAGQNLFDIGSAISGYNIRLNSISQIDSLSAKLQDFLGYPYYVRTIFQVHQNIFTWLELQKEPIPLVLGLIIIVAVLNIIGTLLMMVLERTRSIGILKSLGASTKLITKIFVYQGIYIAIIGIFIGNFLAYILSFLQLNYNIISLPDTVYFLSSVPISIRWEYYLLVSFIALILSLTASLIPSFIAAKIRPVSALRFD